MFVTENDQNSDQIVKLTDFERLSSSVTNAAERMLESQDLLKSRLTQNKPFNLYLKYKRETPDVQSRGFPCLSVAEHFLNVFYFRKLAKVSTWRGVKRSAFDCDSGSVGQRGDHGSDGRGASEIAQLHLNRLSLC